MVIYSMNIKRVPGKLLHKDKWKSKGTKHKSWKLEGKKIKVETICISRIYLKVPVKS